ncbi:MAG: SAM-dependent methyltransferase [Spirochaetaceae bacterium]|nr:SAM-dependent methyltransferase [Spirochaetaceae bacterium]
MESPKGTLYLVPNLLAPPTDSGSTAEALLPAVAVARIRSLRRFVVEGDKAAWRLLSSLMDRESLAAVTLERLDEHTPREELPRLLAPALGGEDLGLLSEAGLPCVADPGSALASLAHDRGIRVVPLVGPSSLIMALSASGLDGQRFSFLGYLPQEPAARRAALAAIDRGVAADGATRLFIETPYRNDRLLADCLTTLGPETRLCVAVSLTSAGERVYSRSVAEWRKAPPLIGKEPAVFLVGRVPGTSLDRPSGFDHSASRICKNKKR